MTFPISTSLLLTLLGIVGCKSQSIATTEGALNGTGAGQTVNIVSTQATVLVGMKQDACLAPSGTNLVVVTASKQSVLNDSYDAQVYNVTLSNNSDPNELKKLTNLSGSPCTQTSFQAFVSDWVSPNQSGTSTSQSTTTSSTTNTATGSQTALSTEQTRPLNPGELRIQVLSSLSGITKIQSADGSTPGTEANSCHVNFTGPITVMVIDNSLSFLNFGYLKVQLQSVMMQAIEDSTDTASADQVICNANMGYVYLPNYDCLNSGGGFTNGSNANALVNPAIDTAFGGQQCGAGQ